uniref:HBS1 like translational GTPase n=1 Tax=Salvator merianae TaxID=96440 RepID=A0A8D0BDC8_SALMN
MARHRNVRGYNYNEDFEEDDLYGHSVEDDYCISPSTAAQFIYSRRDIPSSYTETLEEEYGYEDPVQNNDYVSSKRLTETEKAQLDSCLDYMKEILGEAVPEKVMVEAILNSKFDIQQALDSVLTQDNKQSMKSKEEDSVNTGKARKGLFCSEILSNVSNLITSVENDSGLASSSCSPSDSIVSFESPCNTSSSTDKILSRPKCVKTPLVKKQASESSCKEGALSLPYSDNERSLYESLNDQATLPVTDRTGIGSMTCSKCDACFSSETELLKENLTEKKSWNQSKFKGAQDLKAFFGLDETYDSEDAQASTLTFLQKNSDQYDKCHLDNPPGLTSAFENLMLDNKIKLNKKTELCGHISPFVHGKGSFQGNNTISSKTASLTPTVSRSPSLSEFLQEQQECSSDKGYSLSDLCNPSSVDFKSMELGHPLLFHPANKPEMSSGMTELSGSLSSLTFSRSSPVRELESLSLSDLIAKSIELDKPQAVSNCFEPHGAKLVQPAVVNSDIDLSVLIRKSALVPEPAQAQAQGAIQLPQTGILFSKQEQQMIVDKGRKKSKKTLRSHVLEDTVSWRKALSARPSPFALTLCLHYPPKRCKRKTVNIHKAFLYNRQIPEVNINEIGPLLDITPFDFKSPSPDDIVKSGQKKAFTR